MCPSALLNCFCTMCWVLPHSITLHPIFFDSTFHGTSNFSLPHFISVYLSNLELVGGVEGDLADLLVLVSVVHDVALAQLSALEDGGLGGVSVNFSLQDMDTFLTGFELSPVK